MLPDEKRPSCECIGCGLAGEIGCPKADAEEEVMRLKQTKRKPTVGEVENKTIDWFKENNLGYQCWATGKFAQVIVNMLK